MAFGEVKVLREKIKGRIPYKKKKCRNWKEEMGKAEMRSCLFSFSRQPVQSFDGPISAGNKL